MNNLSNVSKQNAVLNFPIPENSCSDHREISVSGKDEMNALESIAKNDVIKPLPPQSSKVKFFMKWAGLDLLAATVFTIGNIALASSNICLHHHMPGWLAKNLNAMNYPHHLIREILVPDSPILKVAVVAPITEELEYRLVIQEYLLKQLPKKILGKISPTHVDLVDSKVAKCARVVISSFIFALPHYISPETSRYLSPEKDISCFMGNRVFQAFGTGLIMGALQETTGNVAYPIIAHMLHNFIPSVLIKAADINFF
jgi:membrane protease YdiL (CAAX protease family)